MDIKLIKKLRVELERAISRGDNAEVKILEEKIETLRVSINESRKNVWAAAFHTKSNVITAEEYTKMAELNKKHNKK